MQPGQGFREILELILRETGRSNLLAPIPFFVARPLGSLAGLTALVGIPPQLTRDQVVQLESDNVVSEGAEGLEALGVQPSTGTLSCLASFSAQACVKEAFLVFSGYTPRKISEGAFFST